MAKTLRNIERSNWLAKPIGKARRGKHRRERRRLRSFLTLMIPSLRSRVTSRFLLNIWKNQGRHECRLPRRPRCPVLRTWPKHLTLVAGMTLFAGMTQFAGIYENL